MADDKKISELPTITSLSDDDLLPVVDAPGSAPATSRITWQNVMVSVKQKLAELPDEGFLYALGGVLGYMPRPLNLSNEENFTLAWNSVAHADLTFTATGTGNTWDVQEADLQYFKYIIIGKLLIVKVGIISTSVTASTTVGELRVGMPFPIVLGGNDSFGFNVHSEAGFAVGTQDTGQTVCRPSVNAMGLKKRDGSGWATTVNATGVITNMIAELA